jgi:hypothetical protein
MRSVITGPSIIAGNTNPQQLTETDAGPSLVAQGMGLLDPRLVDTIDAAPGRYVAGFYNSEMVSLLDCVPSASAAGNLDSQAGGLVIPAGGNTTPRAINAASQSIAVSVGIPIDIFPPGPVDPVSTVPATLDFGFTTGTGTSGQSTLTIPAGAYKFFKKGQAIAIAGGASATAPLLTQVASTPTGTTLTITGVLGANVTSQPIGSVEPDLVGQPNFASTTGAWPMIAAGAVALWDPTQLLSRCLRVISSSASDTSAFTVTIRGWDVFGVPMTETIALNGTTAAYGKKGWKYVNTIQFNHSGGGTTTGTITLGTGDVFSFPLRSDFFEYMSIYWNAALQTANTGWLVADTTNPATPTTGDVRGTVQLGANGGGTGYTTSPNGSIRLAVFMSVPAYNAVNANNLNYQTLLGMAQNAS